MVQTWIKTVGVDQIVEGQAYFLAVQRGADPYSHYVYYSTDIKGKKILSTKPGIATHVLGNDKLRGVLREHADHVAIEIPADASSRWKRRQRAWKSRA